MKRTDLFIIFIVSMLVYFLSAFLLQVPGYMDAEYYYMGSLNLANGAGFKEMILWNYLDDPQILPHASHLYWMPIPSIIGALGVFLFSGSGYLGAQIPFVLIAAIIPVLTALSMYQLSRSRKLSVLASVFAIFPGIYLIYYGQVETITPFLLFGSLIFYLLVRFFDDKKPVPDRILFLLGLITGLMHMTRNDGLLWLPVTGLLVIINIWEQRNSGLNKFFPSAIKSIAVLVTGYLLVTAAWYIRNITIFHTLFPPGNQLNLWLLEYNQLFAFPSESIQFLDFIQTDLSILFSDRMYALGQNFKTFLAVNCNFVLLPFLIVGIIKNWKRISIKVSVICLLTLLIVMSFIFPYAGWRGGFLHSITSVQACLWCMSAFGFMEVLKWAVKLRNWKLDRAWKMFMPALVAILVLLSIFEYNQKVFGHDPQNPSWQSAAKYYQNVETVLSGFDNSQESILIVNNPPGYWLASGGRPSIVIPYGDEQTLINVTEKYHAEYLLIDQNTVQGLKQFYLQPGDQKGFILIHDFGNSYLYLFTGEK